MNYGMNFQRLIYVKKSSFVFIFDQIRINRSIAELEQQIHKRIYPSARKNWG